MRVRRCYVLLGLVLVGCADPELDELERQLSEVRAALGPAHSLELPRVPEIETFIYQADEQRSPFTLLLPEAEPVPLGSNKLAPDTGRARAPLEAYELERLRLVGSLTISGQTYGLIRAPDGEVHRVRPGDHLGRSHGRVVAITATALQLMELVPSGSGGWIERRTRISLE